MRYKKLKLKRANLIPHTADHLPMLAAFCLMLHQVLVLMRVLLHVLVFLRDGWVRGSGTWRTTGLAVAWVWVGVRAWSVDHLTAARQPMLANNSACFALRMVSGSWRCSVTRESGARCGASKKRPAELTVRMARLLRGSNPGVVTGRGRSDRRSGGWSASLGGGCDRGCGRLKRRPVDAALRSLRIRSGSGCSKR